MHLCDFAPETFKEGHSFRDQEYAPVPGYRPAMQPFLTNSILRALSFQRSSFEVLSQPDDGSEETRGCYGTQAP
jgi:hypothetical protein